MPKRHRGRAFSSHGHKLLTLLAGMVVSGWLAERAPGATLEGSFSPIATGSNVNLTAVGVLDWVHWGLYTDTSVNRKCCVTPQISDFAVIGNTNGFLAAYQYADNWNGYSWSDGEPVSTMTDTPTGVWAYGVPDLGCGFELRLPADTDTRSLQVFVGAYAGRGSFHAFLSDGSAPAFDSTLNGTVSNIRNGPGGVFSIRYAAASPGQTLTVQWTLAQVFQPDGNVTLQAASLSAAGANNPPFVRLTTPANDANFSTPDTIVLTAEASDPDGAVDRVEFYEDTTKIGEATNAPYSCAWSDHSAGHYVVRAVAFDTAGSTGYSAPVEIFVAGSGGSLTGTVLVPPGTVDLDAEGSADWTHWGVSNALSFNRKNTGTPTLGNFTKIGANPVMNYFDNQVAFYWTNGTPLGSAAGTTTGVFTRGMTNGFRVTAPADSTPRQLTVYVGGYGMRGHLQAYLSDFSAGAYADTSISNYFNNGVAAYRLDYSASTPGQELVVLYRPLQLFDLDWGNVTLQAAALQGGPPMPVPVILLEPVCLGDTFTFSFLSESNQNYQVQSTPSFSPPDWQTVTTLPGTGATLYVTNGVEPSQRFYRVVTP